MASPTFYSGSRDAGPADLACNPLDIAGMWSLQGNRGTPLADLVRALFGASARCGDMLHSDGLRLLALSPHQACLLSGRPQSPPQAAGSEALMTDIAHGYRQFRVEGTQAFAFVASYVSADIAPLRERAACLRCRLGQYTVMLWWEENHAIHFLLERSYAESFAEYIDVLMARWRPLSL